MLVGGIDLGSGTTKCVLVDGDGQIRGRALAKTKADFAKVAHEVLEAACVAAAVSREVVAYVATTGLGRYAVPFRDIQMSTRPTAGEEWGGPCSTASCPGDRSCEGSTGSPR